MTCQIDVVNKQLAFHLIKIACFQKIIDGLLTDM